MLLPSAVKRAIRSFHPRHQPWITRQCYRQELVHAMTFPAAAAMIEGGVVGVLAIKAFNVPWLLYATIMAAPMFANLTSFIWARLARGRKKVRCIVVLQIITLMIVAGIALLQPRHDDTSVLQALLLTAMVVLTRCLMTGVITLRSTIWRMNYPRETRARVTGKLSLIASLQIAVLPLLGAKLLDVNVWSFHVLYPLSALIASIGVIAFSRVRLRGERELLRFEASPGVKPQPHGTPGPIYEYDPDTPDANFWAVLKRDHFFRTYMVWQFCSGIANMMGEVVLVALIATLTFEMANAYTVSIALTTATPMLLATLTMPIWARYLDAVHVAVFRARQGWMWTVSQCCYWLGGLAAIGYGNPTLGLTFIAIGVVMIGIARGGGVLAWQLGHNDFADRRLVAVYMGIHVTLTGIRGAIGPFVAMLIYVGYAGGTIPWLNWRIPGLPGIGYHIFLITAMLALIAEIGFIRLARSIGPNAKKAN